jgi:hypothetical protein
MVPDMVPGPQAYFRGESDLPGSGINMGWQIIIKPFKMELESHHHDVDEYLIFLGSTFPDLCGSFDAQIDLFLGNGTVTRSTGQPSVSPELGIILLIREIPSRCSSPRFIWRPILTGLSDRWYRNSKCHQDVAVHEL